MRAIALATESWTIPPPPPSSSPTASAPTGTTVGLVGSAPSATRPSHALAEWETLRELASRIKLHTMSRLAEYLEQFEANATRLGAQVHWARDAAEHNQIVAGILQRHGATRVVKSKSMLTEECDLNPHLEPHGIEVTDTDLGEWIVQLRHEHPSHIVHAGDPHPERRSRRAVPRTARHGSRRDRSDVPGRGRPPRSFATSSSAPRPASPASISPSPRRAASSSARTKATPTWASRCPRCTSPAWASKS